MGLSSFFKRPSNYADPIEQLVVESVENLKKYNPSFETKDLEAEAIYLAAYIYLKDDYRIDFQLDFISVDLLNKIPSEDYQIADKVFHFMKKNFPKKYGQEEYNHGINGYKMNIQIVPNYGAYIKNYFIRAHKIKVGSDYSLFSSTRNCLWHGTVRQGDDSFTTREIYYKIKETSFELMIPPYNPLVAGNIVGRSENIIRCQSSDNKRTFVFHYNGEKTPDNLEKIEMHRNDKGDMVSYHKN